MNERLFQDVNQFARNTPWLHGVVLGYATYGVALFAALLMAGWWTARTAGDRRRVGLALCAGAGTLLAIAVNQPIVNAIHAARPYDTHEHILVLAHRTADYSFPSDHSVMVAAVAGGLFFVSRRLGIAATIAALLMGFARIYIAAHDPADVTAGLLVGAAIGMAFCALLEGPAEALVNVVGRTRLRPLVAPPVEIPAAVT
jgi:undecaprenyl-diphosphatase